MPATCTMQLKDVLFHLQRGCCAGQCKLQLYGALAKLYKSQAKLYKVLAELYMGLAELYGALHQGFWRRGGAAILV